jgi:NADPH:quinone reductase-like Zn-dependent oxidoreductase
MTETISDTMRAAAIDRFGGVETLTPQTLPVPKVGPDEVLIRIEAAGMGSWDCGAASPSTRAPICEAPASSASR